MSANDRRLGMSANITRRDFLNGINVALGASLLPGFAGADEVSAQELASYYPPLLTGMRGAHDGSFEVAHSMRFGASWSAPDSIEEYDLVVVGGGLSGLSAAYFYRQAAGDSARILVIDNHDDFGGHAKRNEFEIDGRSLIGFGGTILMESPAGYPEAAKRLINEIGIDTQRFYKAYDRDLYQSLGLSRGIFFDKETFGSDHLAVGDVTTADNMQEIPLSSAGKADLARLFADGRHYLQDMDRAAQINYLEQTDYETYLSERAGIGTEALRVMRSLPTGVWAIGSDALPAMTAWSSGYPGFGDLDLGLYAYEEENSEPSIFHFPDGNASIARLLVRHMIPGVAPGDSMEDIVTARFDYRKLDDPRSAVRIRLNSTVVGVQHVSEQEDSPVRVTYVTGDAAKSVTAGKVIMACNHSMIPRLCPELPQQQQAMLSTSLRAPLVYTNVLVRNWTSFVNLGLYRANCPGSYHQRVMLDFPVSLGDYAFPKSPDEPMVLHLHRAPGEYGLSAREQFKAGRKELLGTSFDTIERSIRDQLGRMLGAGGFDPARDIAAITVNRWPHGYAYGYDPESDRVAFEPSRWPAEKRHWEQGSKRFGNISIAASDAASNAMTEAAIEEAYRAVNEVSGASGL